MERNAVILAAGTASRFTPLSLECPKGLLEVKGEILIERQIRQLHEAGIDDIAVVTGYMAERFEYLRHKFGVEIIHNEDYAVYNNTSSLIRVLDRLGNTFVCSSDNYFRNNVFNTKPVTSYYSALYADGPTGEYCITTDKADNIVDVSVGGSDSWYMVGHVYLDKEFCTRFRNIFAKEYEKEDTRKEYWEDVYIRHISDLPAMKINRYEAGEIEEFDSLDELRLFDASYVSDTRSSYIKKIAGLLGCDESVLVGFSKAVKDGEHIWFDFLKDNEPYRYEVEKGYLTKL